MLGRSNRRISCPSRLQRLRGDEAGHVAFQIEHTRHVRDVAVILVEIEPALHREKVRQLDASPVIAVPFGHQIGLGQIIRPSAMRRPMIAAVTDFVIDQPSRGVFRSKPAA